MTGGALGAAAPRRPADDRRPTPHEHDRFDELAVGWALHALEPEDEALFAAHLAGCARCARDRGRDHARSWPRWPPTSRSRAVRGAARTGIRAAVEETEQLPEPPSAASPAGRRRPQPPRPVRPAGPAPRDGRAAPPRWRRALPVGLVAAAVAAIVGLGVWNVVLSSDRQQLQSTVAEQSAVMHALLSPGQATIAPLTSRRASRVATVVARGDQVDVITHGLAVNDPDVDHLRALGHGRRARPVALGTFDVTSHRWTCTP